MCLFLLFIRIARTYEISGLMKSRAVLRVDESHQIRKDIILQKFYMAINIAPFKKKNYQKFYVKHILQFFN